MVETVIEGIPDVSINDGLDSTVVFVENAYPIYGKDYIIFLEKAVEYPGSYTTLYPIGRTFRFRYEKHGCVP